MNNQFTTVISYDKPVQGARTAGGAGSTELAGNVIASNDFRALLKALAFMGLWLLLTVMLLAEPLMLNMKAIQAAQEPLVVSHETAPAALPGTATVPPQLQQPQLQLPHHYAAPTTVDAKLSAKPSGYEQHAQLSYAVMVK